MRRYSGTLSVCRCLLLGLTAVQYVIVTVSVPHGAPKREFEFLKSPLLTSPLGKNEVFAISKASVTVVKTEHTPKPKHEAVPEPSSPPSPFPPSPRPPPPSPPPPPPPKYSNCKTFKGPWDGMTVFQLAAEENTTPYDIHTYPYTGKDITWGLDPDTSLEELKKRFKGGVAELKICPGQMKPISSTSCLKDLYDRQPCRYLNGDARFQCLCSFRPDGTFRDPYDTSLTGIYTCQGWQLLKVEKCPAGQVAGPEDYFDPEDPTYTPCVPRPSGYYTKTVGAPCLDASCMCQTYMLPKGLYRNPWDQSEKTSVLCDTLKDKSRIMTYPQLFTCTFFSYIFSPSAGDCIENTPDVMRGKGICAGQLLETDGNCTRTNLLDISCNGPRNNVTAYLELLRQDDAEAFAGGRRLVGASTDHGTTAGTDAKNAEDAGGINGYDEPLLLAATSRSSRHLLQYSFKAQTAVIPDGCNADYVRKAKDLGAVQVRQKKGRSGKLYWKPTSCILSSKNKGCAVIYSRNCPSSGYGFCFGARLVQPSDRCRAPDV